MHTSQINFEVTTDEQKMPTKIRWQAPEGGMPEMQEAKAMLLSLWDGNEKASMRIDLWTKEMMVDEMNDFYFQTFMGLAESFSNATSNPGLANEIKEFAKKFHKQVVDVLNK